MNLTKLISVVLFLGTSVLIAKAEAAESSVEKVELCQSAAASSAMIAARPSEDAVSMPSQSAASSVSAANTASQLSLRHFIVENLKLSPEELGSLTLSPEEEADIKAFDSENRSILSLENISEDYLEKMRTCQITARLNNQKRLKIIAKFKEHLQEVLDRTKRTAGNQIDLLMAILQNISYTYQVALRSLQQTPGCTTEDSHLYHSFRNIVKQECDLLLKATIAALPGASMNQAGSQASQVSAP